jgi:hypothetical protein
VKAQRAAAVTASVLSDVVAAPVDTVRAPSLKTHPTLPQMQIRVRPSVSCVGCPPSQAQAENALWVWVRS